MVSLHEVIHTVADDGLHRFWLLPEPATDGHGFTVADNMVLHPYSWQCRRVKGEAQMEGGKEFQFLTARNVAENDCDGKPDWSELWRREKGKTCLFIGAGPSLKDSIPEIRSRALDKDHYFTLGVNRALTALPELDYLVVADHNCQPDWWKGPGRNEKTILIASNTTASYVPKWFEKVFWYEGCRQNDSGHTLNATHLGITACDALMSAYKLGANRVALYGVDFSTSSVFENGQHFAQNYYHDVHVSVELPKRGRDYYRLPVPFVGADGQQVGVTYEFIAHAARLQAACMMLETGGVKIENCTPKGIFAYARGEDHIPCNADPPSKVSNIVFVSFYTPNYADQAARLKKSLDKWEVRYDIQAIETKPDGWLGAVRFKPRFMREMLDKHRDAKAIVWLDADAECVQYPYVFWAIPMDIAFHPLNGKELVSSTLFWANTPTARKALDVWIDSCDRLPGCWEQQVLQTIIPALECKTVGVIAEEFCWIDKPLPGQCTNRHPGQIPVIVQHQASREVRAGKR